MSTLYVNMGLSDCPNHLITKVRTIQIENTNTIPKYGVRTEVFICFCLKYGLKHFVLLYFKAQIK